MKPSQNLFALAWAFNNETKNASSKDELRTIEQGFIENVAPAVEVISEMFKGVPSNNPYRKQCRFEALVSIASDYGVDLFVDSGIAKMIMSATTRRDIFDLITSIPSMNNTLRPELTLQLEKYSVPIRERRQFEAELYFGNAFFSVARQLDDNINKVFAPTVLHPVFRFLMACANV